jgi:Ca2+-binding EF-hand superfamily protein
MNTLTHDPDPPPEHRIMKPVHAIAITLLVSTLAMADVKTAAPVSETFKSLDRNKDQLISRQEAEVDRSLEDRFAAVDSDGNGFIDEDELLARPDDRPFE